VLFNVKPILRSDELKKKGQTPMANTTQGRIVSSDLGLLNLSQRHQMLSLSAPSSLVKFWPKALFIGSKGKRLALFSACAFRCISKVVDASFESSVFASSVSVCLVLVPKNLMVADCYGIVL